MTLSFVLAAALLLAAQPRSLAGSATWSSDPANDDWNTASNWTPATVPNSTTDVASFATSTITEPLVTGLISLGSVSFASGAEAFTLTLMPTATSSTVLFFYEGGVINNSGKAQTFLLGFGTGMFFYNNATAGQMVSYSGNMGAAFVFYNSSSAGSANFDVSYGPYGPGEVSFSDTATAADSTINVFGSDIYFSGSATAANAVMTAIAYGGPLFGSNSTAGNAVITVSSQASADFTNIASADHGTFTANGAQTSSDTAGSVQFGDSTTAAEGTFIINGGAVAEAAGATMSLVGSANAGQAIITVNGGRGGGLGGTLFFHDKSNGASACVSIFGNATLDLSDHKTSSVLLGSLAGEGSVLLGPNTLTIGSNNQNTVFSGVIENGSNGSGGSLSKVGAGTLTLSGVNLYGGGTIVEEGTLLVKTKRDSATGPGPVQVNAGTFGGRSNIAGAVTIGSGSGAGATLAPGIEGPGVLAIHNTLTFQADGNYHWEVNLARSKGDEVICKGATIASGAQFTLDSRGNQALPAGTVFTVIENKTRQPISGTFANLPDGAILNVNGNQLQASYKGGDGNDLTLTVLP